MTDYRTKNIRTRLVGLGVDLETFDYKAHLDPRLTQHENLENLKHQAHVSVRKEHRGEHGINFKHEGPGESLHLDAMRPAMPPGKRIVQHPGSEPTVYYEHRRNRSDRPGRRI